MAHSTKPAVRLAVTIVAAFMVVVQALPSDARAAFTAGTGVAAVAYATGEAQPVNELSTGDHHPRKSFAELAAEFEAGARKHARAGNHKEAAAAYREAARLWKLAGELAKAEAAERKAAEHEKLAGK